MPRLHALVAGLVLASGNIAAYAQPNVRPAPKVITPADTKPPKPQQPDAKQPDAKPADAKAGEGKEIVKAAADALKVVTSWTYKAKVEGAGSAAYTADVTLAKTAAKQWLFRVEGEIKTSSSSKGKKILAAFDGTAARSVREAQKEFAVLSGPPALKDVAVFMSREKIAGPVAWELLASDALTIPEGAAVTAETAHDVEGTLCDVVRIDPKPDPKKDVDSPDLVSGRYYFGQKDHLLRKVERFKPSVGKPETKALRTVTFSDVKYDTAPVTSMAPFTIESPQGFTKKEEVKATAIKPIEDAKKDVKPAAPDRGLLAVGTDAPEWSLKDGTGATKTMKDYRGKVVVMDFWGTWCGWCVKAMPQIQNVYSKYKDKGVTVLGMDYEGDPKADPAKFMKDKGCTYELILKAETISKNYKVSGWPTMYVIDQQGKIIWAHSGYSDTLEKELSEVIDKALASGKK